MDDKKMEELRHLEQVAIRAIAELMERASMRRNLINEGDEIELLNLGSQVATFIGTMPAHIKPIVISHLALMAEDLAYKLDGPH